MVEYLKEILKVEKKDTISESELFDKLREFLDSEKQEYASFALTTMIVDSFVSGSTICKSTKEIKPSSSVEVDFVVI